MNSRYVYSCCPESLDGLSEDTVKTSYANKVLVPGKQVVCLNCGNIYDIHKLGLTLNLKKKFNHNEIIAARDMADRFIAGHPMNETEVVFKEIQEYTLADVRKILCNLCKQPAFVNEPLDVQESFRDDVNFLLNTLKNILGSQFTQSLMDKAISDMHHGMCRSCHANKKKQTTQAQYN